MPSNHEVFERHGTKYVTTPARGVSFETHGNHTVAACAGFDANILLCDDGSCLVSGENSDGELGQGDMAPCRDRFHRLDVFGERIIKTSTTLMNHTSLHTLLLTSSGKMFGCGSNTESQLVPSNAIERYTSPRQLTSCETFRDICASDGVSFAASRDGDGVWKLHCCGSGQLQEDVIYDRTMDVDGPVTTLAVSGEDDDNLLVVTSPRNSAERVYEWIPSPIAEAARLECVLDLAVGTFVEKVEARILMVGLDGAGKTTILYRFKLGEVVTTIPTTGFNVESVDYKSFALTMWDVGGQDKIRPFWRHYYQNTQAVVFVVDSNDRDRVPEAKEVLHRMLAEGALSDSRLLVFANKQDLTGAMSAAELTEGLGLNELRGRSWHIQACSSTTGDGLSEGLDWLAEHLPRTQAGAESPE